MISEHSNSYICIMEISQLNPQEVWSHFAALNDIPRASKKEEKVIRFMQDFGEKIGLETKVDETGNVLIRKPARKGLEDREPVVLQAHLDMVHQKNADVDFDFDTEGIKMVVEGDWVKADGTTLGADNGMGVAAIMAVLESKDIEHPALEALFTVDEETGMTGAEGLKKGFLKGKILLNLDTEEDDEISIGCAGGVDVTARKSYKTESYSGTAVRIVVKGLQGGHSGMDIHKGLGNANVLLGRLLWEGLDLDIRVVEIDSGGLRNAIPREGQALVAVKDSKVYIEKLQSLIAAIQQEYSSLEKTLTIEVSTENVEANSLDPYDSKQFIQTLRSLHNGVYRMSPDVDGLVEASNNIARIGLKDGVLEILCLTRSSVESTKKEVADTLEASFLLGDMEVELSGDYPGWEPNPTSKIVSLLTSVYQAEFGSTPKVSAGHAGLECGIIGGKYPKMEMVSFGPTIRGAHSPDEKVSLSSVQKFWLFLKNILKEIPKKES